MKLNGVVVLYKPENEVITNLLSYSSLLNKLYVIDNSETTNTHLVGELQKIINSEYIELRENKGIAYAFNLAAEKSITQGVQWLLTMDQDSKFEDSYFERFIEDFRTIDKTNVGIFAPFNGIYRYEHELKKGIIETNRVISSGNLINLDAYSTVGGFDEKLFIDFVDHDYCFKLRKSGYKILVDYNISLNHKLGNLKIISFLGKKRLVMDHNPLRKYYITRNRLEIIRRYFLFYKQDVIKMVFMFFYELFFMLFFEDKKLLKLKMIYLGIIDNIGGRFGKYSH